MLKSYLKYYLRIFSRHRVYTFLNGLGLAIGLSLSLIILLYLQSDLTYDQHYPDHDRIYRISSVFEVNGESYHTAGSGIGMAPMLSGDLEGIRSSTRIGQVGKNVMIRYEGQTFFEDDIFFSDSDYFKVFQTPFIHGSPDSSLTDPHSMVVTKSFAKRVFNQENPIGERVSTSNNYFVVTGVVEDLPHNSHIRFQALLPAFTGTTDRRDLEISLWSASVYTFVRMKPGYSKDYLLAEFPGFYDRYMRRIGESLETGYTIFPERLDRIHMFSKATFDLPHGNSTYLIAFAGIGLLILTMAIINYVNMSTARAQDRVKEAGIRMALGSSRNNLILHFLGESLLLTFLSFALALIFTELLLSSNSFADLVTKDLRLDFLHNPLLIWGGLGLTLIVGLAAGIYPAWFLSTVNPIYALKGSLPPNRKRGFLRGGLVTFQLVISIAVVVVSFLMGKQMDFLSDKYLGFNKEEVVVIPMMDTTLIPRFPAFKQGLKGEPDILAIATTNSLPGDQVGKRMVKIPTGTGSLREIINFMIIGDGFLNALEIPLLEGKTFEQIDPNGLDTGVVIVNEAFVKHAGWTHPIGKILQFGEDEENEDMDPQRVVVIGVCGDFNANSLHEPIQPLMLMPQEKPLGQMLVRIDPDHQQRAFSSIEEHWTLLDPEKPFEVTFLSDHLREIYEEDRKQSDLMSWLMIITIAIACLGLLGLASFTTRQRTREIGVRKVLGASQLQIVWLVFKEVSQLVLTAVLFAFPLAYLLFIGWQRNFAYLAPIGWGVFIFTGLLALMMAYLVVSYHAVRAARSSPIKALRYE